MRLLTQTRLKFLLAFTSSRGSSFRTNSLVCNDDGGAKVREGFGWVRFPIFSDGGQQHFILFGTSSVSELYSLCTDVVASDEHSPIHLADVEIENLSVDWT